MTDTPRIPVAALLRRLTALAWLGAGLALVVPPHMAAGQSLEESLAITYENNPQLLAARASLRAVDEGVPQALAGWRPRVTLSGDAGLAHGERDTPITARTGSDTEPMGGSFTVSQNIYRGGRTVAATRRAEATVETERARLLSVEQQVLLSGVAAYADVVRDQAVVELTINNERVLERELEATRDRFRVGEVTRTDVAQAESRLSGAISDRIAAEGQLIQSRANYQSVVGIVPQKLSAAKPFGDLPANEEEAIQLAREKSYSVVAAKFAEDSASARVREVLGELLPAVSLQGDATHREDSTGEGINTDSLSVQARVSMPLYQAGDVSSRVRQAKQTAAQRRNELNNAVRVAVETATGAWESLQTARAQIESFTAQVRAARIALEGVQQEAQVGSRTVLNVLDAEQELLNSQVNLVRAQRNEIVAAANVRAAVGTLTAEKLDLLVKLYDFSDHYKKVRDRWYGTGIDEQ